jgi:hypothetical protein
MYTRVVITEIYRLSGMKSFRDDLIDRVKTGWGRFVLASRVGTYRVQFCFVVYNMNKLDIFV